MFYVQGGYLSKIYSFQGGYLSERYSFQGDYLAKKYSFQGDYTDFTLLGLPASAKVASAKVNIQ